MESKLGAQGSLDPKLLGMLTLMQILQLISKLKVLQGVVLFGYNGYWWSQMSWICRFFFFLIANKAIGAYTFLVPWSSEV